MSSASEKAVENAKREKLRREKPLVYDKVIKIKERVENKIPTPMIDLAYSYRCNLHCSHCMVSRMTPKDTRLSPEKLRDLSNQADMLGLCQFTVSGGEPLTFPDLNDVITALQPDKFHLAMSSNGLLLTEARAKELKSLGLDKIKISIDDFDPAKHDENRNNEGCFEQAVKALFYAQKAGLSAVIQTVISHQNCRSDQTVKLADFGQKNGFAVDVMLAKAIGKWEGKTEVLIDDEDMDFLKQVHEEYPALHLDTFPTYGIDRGCAAVDSNLHITAYGDVLPCGFIHISIGNIFEESLDTILKRGMNIKFFGTRQNKCLAGHNRYFIHNYMSKFYGKKIPVSWRDVFEESDFINEQN